MGLFALPNIIIFQMLLPLVSPFIDLMLALMITGDTINIMREHASRCGVTVDRVVLTLP